MAQVRLRMHAKALRAQPVCVLSAPIVSVCWRRAPSSMPASPHRWRKLATFASSLNPARSRPGSWNGRRCATSVFPRLSRSATTSMSILPTEYVWLDPIAIGKVLAAYGIATTPVSLARDPDEAATAARPHLAKGDAVVLKIQSPDIVHKSEVGG